MSINQLLNPKTPEYIHLKSAVNKFDFPWFWGDSATPDLTDSDGFADLGFYSHTILDRPTTVQGNNYSPKNFYYPAPRTTETFISDTIKILIDILYYNRIKVLTFYRMSINCVHPTGDNKLTIPHNDHPFPHKNIIIYLSDADGGETICEGDKFLGKEDDIIMFEGIHNHRPPLKNRRLVLVATGLFEAFSIESGTGFKND